MGWGKHPDSLRAGGVGVLVMAAQLVLDHHLVVDIGVHHLLFDLVSPFVHHNVPEVVRGDKLLQLHGVVVERRHRSWSLSQKI